MNTDNNWVSSRKQLPPEMKDNLQWSEDVYIKIGNWFSKTIRKGYYDYFLEQWFCVSKNDMYQPVPKIKNVFWTNEPPQQ